jgi:hypothetical protein
MSRAQVARWTPEKRILRPAVAPIVLAEPSPMDGE